jgi:hypothetical protein
MARYYGADAQSHFQAFDHVQQVENKAPTHFSRKLNDYRTLAGIISVVLLFYVVIFPPTIVGSDFSVVKNQKFHFHIFYPGAVSKEILNSGSTVKGITVQNFRYRGNPESLCVERFTAQTALRLIPFKSGTNISGGSSLPWLAIDRSYESSVVTIGVDSARKLDLIRRPRTKGVGYTLYGCFKSAFEHMSFSANTNFSLLDPCNGVAVDGYHPSNAVFSSEIISPRIKAIQFNTEPGALLFDQPVKVTARQGDLSFHDVSLLLNSFERVLHQRDLGQCRVGADLSSLCSFTGLPSLPADYTPSDRSDNDQPPVGVSRTLGPFEGCVPPLRNVVGLSLVVSGLGLALFSIRRGKGWLLLFSWLWIWTGIFIGLTGHHPCVESPDRYHSESFEHDGENCTRQKVPDSLAL